MADVLEVGATIDLDPLLPGLEKMASSISEATTASKASMDALAEGSQVDLQAVVAALNGIQGSVEGMGASFEANATAVNAAMARMASGVRTSSEEAGFSLTELKREFGEVAESAELSAAGTVSALGPLGAIFGVGLLTHYAEGLKEVVLENGRLSDITGESISRIVQFRGAMETLGVPSENLSRLLVHLASMEREAADGQQLASEGFKQLGIDTDNWNKKLPDTIDVLLKISDHLHEFKGSAQDAGAAGQILGQRLGIELAGGLAVGSEAIRERMAAHKALGDAMETERANALKLQETEAEATAKIQQALLPLLGFFADFINTTHLLWISFSSDFREVANVIDATNLTIAAGIGASIRALAQVASFDFSGAKSTMQTYADGISNIWHGVSTGIGKDNEDIRKAISEITEKPLVVPQGGAEDTTVTTAKNRVQIWKEALDQQKADADNFHAVSASDEVNYWDRILGTQKLNAKERLAVEQELNRAKHAAALQAYQEQIALDEEFSRVGGGGSSERRAALNQEAAFARQAYGDTSKEAISANMKILDNQINDDKLAADSVRESVAQQSAAYKAGSAERIAILGKGLAELKVMQDNLAASKTAVGGPEISAPVGPTPGADSALRIAARHNESAEIQKIIDSLTATLQSDYRAETTEAEKQDLQRERDRLEGTQRVLELQVSSARTSSDEQIKEVERLAQYDLITFNQKIAMTRAIVETEKERELSAERVAIAEAQGEVAGARTDEQREAALKRLAALQQEYLKTLQRVAQQEIQISDQVANKQIQDAQRAANVISTSFESAFDKMLTQHTNFLNQATKFWDQMVQGWAKMGIQILANYVQTLAQIVLREILTQTQISTVQQSQITLREATQNLWQTFLNTLGIKTTTQATATETQETAAHTTGITARKAADTAAQAQTLLLQTQQLTQFTTNETAETTAHTVGIAARQAADASGYAATAAENAAIITSEAGVAGAAAFASAMVALPFPANIPAATAAMAAAITTTLSNLGLGAAEKGALLDSDRLVAAHANELILPSKISSGLQNAISTGTFSTPAALSQHFAAASGASSNSTSTSTVTKNNNVHMNGDIQVINQGGGKMDTSEISSQVRRAFKRGML